MKYNFETNKPSVEAVWGSLLLDQSKNIDCGEQEVVRISNKGLVLFKANVMLRNRDIYNDVWRNGRDLAKQKYNGFVINHNSASSY